MNIGLNIISFRVLLPFLSTHCLLIIILKKNKVTLIMYLLKQIYIHAYMYIKMKMERV